MASSALLVLGKEMLDEKDYESAVTNLEKALLYEPHNVETISTLGHARVGDGYSYEIPSFPSRLDAAADQAPPIKFVTFASDTTRCEFRRLVASAKYHGVELNVLGAGIETRAWKNGLKLKLLRGFAEAQPEGDFLVVVDGYDVVIGGREEEFWDRYLRVVGGAAHSRSQGVPDPVVFQADHTFYCPLNNQTASSEVAWRYPPSPTKYKFLSSGGIMGSAEALANLIEVVVKEYANHEWEMKSDQSLFIRYLVDCHHSKQEPVHPLYVDHYMQLFGGNGGNYMKDFAVEEGRLIHTKTAGRPVSLHTPGRKK